MKERERLDTVPPDPSREEPRPPEAAPIEDVLALQRTAGNRAVSGMLARQPAPDTADAPVPADTGRGSTTTLILGEDMVIPVESASFGGGGGPGAGPPGQAQIKDLHVAFVMSDAVPKLMQMAAEGTAIPVAVLSVGTGTSTMKEVYVTSVHVSPGGGEEQHVSVSLNFAEVEHKH